MPRLTNQLYYDRHKFLRRAWQQFNTLYGALPAGQQWQLHAYYRPTERLSLDQLVAHRRRVTMDRPNLPQAASKAFARMFRVFLIAYKRSRGDDARLRDMIRQAVPVRSRSPKVRLVPVLRPEPDFKLWSRALIMLYQELERGKASHDRRAAE